MVTIDYSQEVRCSRSMHVGFDDRVTLKSVAQGSKFSEGSTLILISWQSLTSSDQIWHNNASGKKRVLGGQPRPLPKGRAPASPNFWDLHARAQYEKQQPDFCAVHLSTTNADARCLR